MADWGAFSAADFDARQADKRALRQARQAAETGQAGLFFVATPERERKAAPVAEQLHGQTDLFGPADDSPSAAGHEPDPDPEQGAFDVCRKCGQPIRERPETGAWVTMTSFNAECYARRS